MGKKKTGAKKKPKPALKTFIKRAIALGAKSAKVINASTVRTAPWVRLKCRFGCHDYGKSLVCPPHTPTDEEMKKTIKCYKKAILFEHPGQQKKDIAAKLEREIFLSGYYKALGLAARSCLFCKKCAVDSMDCRHAERARPSMEACGIDVYETLRANGIDIEVVKNKKHPAHFYGIVFVE
ncbi:MAG: DUF2284 domain-containing protein [Planctomycetota bacterium]|nr:MAG: DUF2284 domain-containing protein [Planctomycetota bacterium]